jgi:hypothetical protein
MAVPSPLRPVAGVSLDALAEDPSRTRNLPPDMARDLLARVMALSPLLLVAALRGHEHGPVEPDAGAATQTADEWLTAEEAAPLVKQSRGWLVRHHRALPFARKISPKTIRFSRTGALRWMETRPR